MRIERIRATDLFSFETLDLRLEPSLTVLVGPNGAGKTNVIRAVELACQAVAFASNLNRADLDRLVDSAAIRRVGAQPRATVSLDVTLDSTEERRAIAAFVRAAVLSELIRADQRARLVPEVVRWLEEQITDVTVEPLCRGVVSVVAPRDQRDAWDVSYRFVHAGSTYAVSLASTFDGVRRENEVRLDGLVTEGISSRLGLHPDAVAETHPFDWQVILPAPGQATALAVEPVPAQPGPPEVLRAFFEAIGVPEHLGAPRVHGLGSVLSRLVTDGVALLSEVHAPPRRFFRLGDDVEGGDRASLPLRLFAMKNGELDARRRYAEIQRRFAALTGERFDLVASPVPDGDEVAGPANLAVRLVVPHHNQDIPIELSGAGAWEAVAISTLVSSEPGTCLILDEPAANLHPAAQRRLLGWLTAETSPQSLVVTHSPFMIPAGSSAQLASIARLDRREGLSRLHRLDIRDDSARRSTWAKELAGSADVRGLLFASGVILLEGETELGALGSWFNACPTARRWGGPEQLDVGVYFVGGDPNFRTYIEICDRFGLPWAAVCDGAVMAPGRPAPPSIFDQLLAAGVGDERLHAWLADAKQTSLPFAEIVSCAREYGVFTLARESSPGGEGFEAFLASVAPDALAAARRAEPGSKVRQGRYVASTVACPDEVDALYGDLLSRLGVLAPEGSRNGRAD